MVWSYVACNGSETDSDESRSSIRQVARPLCQLPNCLQILPSSGQSCNLVHKSEATPLLIQQFSHQPTGLPLVIEPSESGSSWPLHPLTNTEVRRYQSPQCMGSQRRGSEFLLSPRPARCPERLNRPNLPD